MTASENKIIKYQMDGLWHDELLDFMLVNEMGAKKYSSLGYLEKDGKKCSIKDMHSSLYRHMIKSCGGPMMLEIIRENNSLLREEAQRADEESGLDHLLHIASRCMMLFTRIKRNITHSDDEKGAQK